MTVSGSRKAPDRGLRFFIEPPRPYSLALTVERFTRFPEVVDVFAEGTYQRLLDLPDGAVLMSARQTGTPGRARLRVELMGSQARSTAAREMARRVLERSLGARSEVRAFYRAFRTDPILASPIRRFRGLRIAGMPSLWEALVTAVLSQQITLSFAYDIRRRLAEAFGRRARFGGKEYVAFPSPSRLAGERPRELEECPSNLSGGPCGPPNPLAGFRLSRSKAETVLRLGEAFASGDLSEEELEGLSDEEAVARLVSFKGVGRWTAEIALLRGLGRHDVFPAGDLGVVKYLAQGLLARVERASESEMRRFSQRWRPYRSLALIYAYAELADRRRRNKK